MNPPLIGVLAMQGAFAEHVRALEAVGARTRLVRTREELDGLDGIVLPGGESTTMTMLMERVGLLEPLRDAIQRGLATLATCAGMIVLARDITDGMADQHGLGLLDIGVRRNGYGRQVDSFEAPLHIEGMNGETFPGVFIRAPLVERAGDVEVVGSYNDHPVAVRHGRILALCFHPELSGDLRLHREFVRLASAHA
jgi:pyridoxal 5'-phosphate synthase pdxT subunit